MTEMKFWRMALPFIMVNAVVWGVASIALPVLAGSDSRAGLVFAMLNLGLAIGAFIWGYLSRKVGLSILLFSSTLFSAAVWIVLVLLDGTLLPLLAFVFGIFAAAIWALATVQVTRSYPKQEWDSHIARMQSFLVLGQVMGLLIASASSKPVLGIPLLGLAVLATLPVRLSGEGPQSVDLCTRSIIFPKPGY
jgi:MFS family permease